MTWAKIIKLNLFATLFLLLLIELGLSFIFYLKDSYVSKEGRIELNDQHNITHEFLSIKNETKNFREYPYKAFVGWVSPNISGSFVNVENERRKTYLSKDILKDNVIHFIGGSTMWGYGVSDKNTIPSLVSNILNLKTINYGELAYNSRQELNLLINNINDIHTNDVVVFFDGVNDIYHNCRNYNSWNGHAREFFIKNILIDKKNTTNVPKWIINLSIYRFVVGVGYKLGAIPSENIKPYVNACDNEDYAEKVADFVVNNWKTAMLLLNYKNVNFICALQPNPYTYNGEIYYKDEEFSSQIGAVYPLIRKKAKSLSCFEDYSYVMKKDHYTDSCCHMNEYGNKEIAKKFAKSLFKFLPTE